jgi:hypothetical protein
MPPFLTRTIVITHSAVFLHSNAYNILCYSLRPFSGSPLTFKSRADPYLAFRAVYLRLLLPVLSPGHWALLLEC